MAREETVSFAADASYGKSESLQWLMVRDITRERCNLRKLRWELGIEFERGGRFMVENCIIDDGRCPPAECRSAGRHFIEHGPKAEQISARVHFLAAGLLGGHIRDGPHGYAGTGEQFVFTHT